MDVDIGHRTYVKLEPRPGRFEFNTGDDWMLAATDILMRAVRAAYLHPERQLERLHAGEWVRVNGIVYRFIPDDKGSGRPDAA